MSFLLRALLVIGALSYCALKRGEPGDLPSAEAVTAALAGAAPAAIQAVNAGLTAANPGLAGETRERVAREALAGLIRRAGQPVPEIPDPASRDTLSATDRAPAWRGIEAR